MKSGGIIALVLLVSCRGEPPRETAVQGDAKSVPPPSSPVLLTALLPSQGRPATPSLAKLPTEAAVDGTYLADVSSCGSCHPDVLAQQQGSAHALGSLNNPIYRLAIENLREKVGKRASETCAGCHDVALLIDGAMAQDVLPSDFRAHNGVSCRLCHGIEVASRDGNASYELRARPLPLPESGDAESLLRHKEAASRQGIEGLCGSCHQSFLSPASGNAHFLSGQSELVTWANSAYAGAGSSRVDQVPAKTCIACHMQQVDAPLGDVAADEQGKVSSHAFLGGHTWLAAMRGDEKQLRDAREFLVGVATIDALSEINSNGEVSIDVVVRNTGVGHRFPGGVRDVANTWIELEVLTAEKKVVLHSSGKDSVHRLRALVADEEGNLLQKRETHRFAALVADHTIAPRDVALVRYRGTLPSGQAPALVRARLVHQSRGEELVRATCAEARSERGRAYARARQALERPPLDACRPAPTTIIAEVSRPLGDQGDESFTRSYERGLGLLHEVQERVDTARPTLTRALSLAGEDALRRAMVLHAMGTLEARLGRSEEALRVLRLAQGLVPTSAAVFASEGDALARVWRWPEAATAYAKAVDLAEGNASLWRRYSLALGSAGQQGKALHAAQRGLRLVPRDADLLRIQALALRSLGAEDAQAAMAAYLDHRGLDNVGNIRLQCAQKSAHCRRESLPVHEHPLHQPVRPKRHTVQARR